MKLTARDRWTAKELRSFRNLSTILETISLSEMKLFGEEAGFYD
jgi:hypothetical protein